MIPMVKDEWMKESGKGDTFRVEMSLDDSSFDNFFIESKRSAEQIYSFSQGDLHILYSGGIDSEYWLSIFLTLGIPIKPVIIKLNPHYNDHDLKYALDFCESKNITPTVIDIDYDNFVKSGKMVEYAQKYQSDIYQLSTTMHACSLIDGTILHCHGEPWIKKNIDTLQWDVTYYEWEYSIYRMLKDKNLHGVSLVGCWTQGVFKSWISDPIMPKLAKNLIPGKLGSQSSKHYIYNRYSDFQLVIRPKYHGYEIIEQSDIFKHEAFQELKITCGQFYGAFKQEYFEFMRTHNITICDTDS